MSLWKFRICENRNSHRLSVFLSVENFGLTMERNEYTATADVVLNIDRNGLITEDTFDYIKARLTNVFMADTAQLYAISPANVGNVNLHFILWGSVNRRLASATRERIAANLPKFSERYGNRRGKNRAHQQMLNVE